MQIFGKMPQLAPQGLMRAPRSMWLLTAALIILFLALQRIGLSIPIPFLLLMLTVAISGAIAGTLSGVISGLLMSGFIIYSWWIGYGPDALTGNLFRALLGCAVSTALGVYLGIIRDQLVGSYSELQEKRAELTLVGEELHQRVRRQTHDLEQTHDELKRQQGRLQRISKRWIDSQEAERRNIARDLHDDLGQILTALRINLDNGGRAVDPESGAAKIFGRSTELVDTALESVRRLSFSLRPSLLDDLGLTSAVREHASRSLQDADIGFNISSEGNDSNISPETGIAAFRISQEAISNVLEHSDASNVEVSVRTDLDSVRLEISDDGKGFDVDEDHDPMERFGLASMRERAALAGGSTTVESELGVGTNVRVCLPLKKQGEVA